MKDLKDAWKKGSSNEENQAEYERTVQNKSYIMFQEVTKLQESLNKSNQGKSKVSL